MQFWLVVIAVIAVVGAIWYWSHLANLREERERAAKAARRRAQPARARTPTSPPVRPTAQSVHQSAPRANAPPAPPQPTAPKAVPETSASPATYAPCAPPPAVHTRTLTGIGLDQVARYAGTNSAKWQLLVGEEIDHPAYGLGRVVDLSDTLEVRAEFRKAAHLRGYASNRVQLGQSNYRLGCGVKVYLPHTKFVALLDMKTKQPAKQPRASMTEEPACPHGYRPASGCSKCARAARKMREGDWESD